MRHLIGFLTYSELSLTKHGEKSMKCLFIVKDAQGKQVGEAVQKKMNAKSTRDALNKTKPGHTIGLGPDHMGKHKQKTKYRNNKTR